MTHFAWHHKVGFINVKQTRVLDVFQGSHKAQCALFVQQKTKKPPEGGSTC